MTNKYIGICVPKDDVKKKSVFLFPYYWCFETIAKMVIDNNCFPIILFYEDNMIDKYLDMINGLILVGDRDIHPKYYGATLTKVDEEMGLMANERMDFQIKILKKILINKEKKIPVLGICAGMQSINVAMGGTLYQDLSKDVKTAIDHRQGDRGLKEIAHYIDVIDKKSFIYNAVKKEHFGVTTNHHQAIKDLANGFRITGVSSEDKIIEAIEFCGDVPCFGFQWHLERYATEDDINILRKFFNMC